MTSQHDETDTDTITNADEYGSDAAPASDSTLSGSTTEGTDPDLVVLPADEDSADEDDDTYSTDTSRPVFAAGADGTTTSTDSAYPDQSDTGTSFADTSEDADPGIVEADVVEVDVVDPAPDAADTTEPAAATATTATPAAATPAAATSADSEHQWSELQALFVDDPRGSVEQAASLVESEIQALLDAARARQTSLSEPWQSPDADTEVLRTALRSLRSFWTTVHEDLAPNLTGSSSTQSGVNAAS